jgi:glycosidase
MRNENSCHNITHCWQRLNGIEGYMLNFLENHDEQRIASPFFAGSAEKGIPAMIVSAALSKGPVMIYNGQEFGEKADDAEGFSGADGRTTIFDYWTIPSVYRWLNCKLKKEEKSLQNFYQKLLIICQSEKAISEGEFFDLEYANFNNPDFNTHKQYTFIRKQDDELLLIAVNFEDFDVNIGINIPQHAFDHLQIPVREEVLSEELLRNTKSLVALSPEKQLKVSIPKNNGAIIKISL